MEGILLQDLITVRTTTGLHVVQSASAWLDLGDLEDVVFYTEVREIAGVVALTFETSCVALDAAFVPLATVSPLGVGLTTTTVLASMAKVPAMRFIRWNITGTGAPLDATFRIWIAAHGCA